MKDLEPSAARPLRGPSGLRTGIDDGPRIDGSDLPERKQMAQKVKITLEDGSERFGYLDMRTFRERNGNLNYQDPATQLDLTKPLALRRGGGREEIKIWFVEGRFIYGAYRYHADQKWIQHAWFLDGSALARIRPHNNDLVHEAQSEGEALPEASSPEGSRS
jgi:hypothetical protein